MKRKAKPIKRRFISNQPSQQNVGGVNPRKRGTLMKPRGRQLVVAP